MDIFRLAPGESPLVVSIPHCGTQVPPTIERDFTAAGRLRADTDWHVDRLYDFAAGLGASVIAATHSRYVIDLNRRPDNAPLYPGADNTELCPTTTFDREPIYRPGAEPDAAEIARRTEAYWRPYHQALTAEIARVRGRHGIALLFDAHSIRSRVPRFFEGRLPDLNLGTAGGASADPALTQSLVAVCGAQTDFTHILNGRFKGGHITRAHGRPGDGVHAIQLEQAQITYMDEAPPFAYRPERAERVRLLLTALLTAMLAWAKDN